MTKTKLHGLIGRMSDAYTFSEVKNLEPNKTSVDKCGVYEIGFVNGEDWIPKYIGETKNAIRIRLMQYWHEERDKCNSEVLKVVSAIKLGQRENDLYCCWRAVASHQLFELIMLEYVKVQKTKYYALYKKFGFYEWNKQDEPSPRNEYRDSLKVAI